MASNQLSLTNVINISVATAQTGVNAYNTSNLGLFSGEPVASAVQSITLSGVAASGAFVLKFNGASTASINYNDTLSAIQGKINAVSGMANATLTGSVASQVLTLSQPGQFGALPLAVVSTNTLQTSGSVAITLSPATVSLGWSGGSFGYALYTGPTQVGIDFGTSSRTYQMANAIFSQQPNILTGGGQLVVILMAVGQQTLTFSAVAASGAFELEYNSNTSASIPWNASPSAIQTALQALPGLSGVQVTGSIAGELLTVIFNGVYGAPLALSVPANTLETSGSASITVTPAVSVAGESIGAAITRTQGLVQYFGAMTTVTLAVIGQTDLLAAAAVIQPLNVIGAFVSYNTADSNPAECSIFCGRVISLRPAGSIMVTLQAAASMPS